MSCYVATFTFKDENKNQDKKLTSFRIDDLKLLESYKTIWTNIEDLKNIELNAFPVYDDRYTKTKNRNIQQ